MGKSARVTGKFPRSREERSCVGTPSRRGPPRSSGSLERWRFGGVRQRGRAGRTRKRRAVAEQAPPAPPTSPLGLRQPRHAQEGDSREGVRVPRSAAVGPALRLPFDAEARKVAELREGASGARWARRRRRPPGRRVGAGAGENPSRAAEANGRQGGLDWPMTVDGARCQPKSACPQSSSDKTLGRSSPVHPPEGRSSNPRSSRAEPRAGSSTSAGSVPGKRTSQCCANAPGLAPMAMAEDMLLSRGG